MIDPLEGGLDLEDHHLELRGGPVALPDRHYLWQPERRVIVGGVSAFSEERVWTADTPSSDQRAAWIAELDTMASLEPELVVPGHRLPGAPADASALAATRDYLTVFESELNTAKDSKELVTAMTARYPDCGLGVSIDIGAKVALGGMSWG